MHEHVAQLRQEDSRSLGTILPLAGRFATSGLTWWPQLGIGYYPVTAGLQPYDQDYFDRFDRDARTELGKALMQARVNFVEKHYRGPLIDIGIGSGAFVELRRKRSQRTYGYDINPAGIEWLQQRHLFLDPYLTRFDAITLWDVLEHIPDFQLLLSNVREWVFLSLPIFYSAEHALNSKHFRPLEHYWYFTRHGLIHAMQICGFELVSESNIETELGREDIGTFTFRRNVNGL
jgi:predicted TPR repeat methyltransferase